MRGQMRPPSDKSITHRAYMIGAIARSESVIKQPLRAEDCNSTLKCLRQLGVENPDREIARLEAEGRLIIEATDFGQGRHGVGLYEDPRKQLIKLRVG